MTPLDRLPSYYTVLPAAVRYDFKRLSWFEIVLFGEIVSMATVTGYAFVSNSYLAALYDRDETSISKSISKLAAAGHLNIVIEKGFIRKIYIITPLVKTDNPPLVENNKGSRARQNASLFNKEISNNDNKINRALTPSMISSTIKEQFRVPLDSNEMPEPLKQFYKDMRVESN
jgi:hypothetical protein